MTDLDDGLDAITREQVRNAYEVLQRIGAGPRGHVTVVGGMVPTLRRGDCTAELVNHTGTADLDLTVSIVMAAGVSAAYYQGLTDALRAAGLRPEPELQRGSAAWRWLAEDRNDKRQVELLVETTHNGMAGQSYQFHNTGEHGGDAALSAVQFDHCELTFVDRSTVDIPLILADGTYQPHAEFPLAGLGSWLCMKLAAATTRGNVVDPYKATPPGKDYYDIAWMLLCLGPDVAAEELAASPLRDDHRDTLNATLDRLREQYATRDHVAVRRSVQHLTDDPDHVPTVERQVIDTVVRTVDGYRQLCG